MQSTNKHHTNSTTVLCGTLCLLLCLAVPSAASGLAETESTCVKRESTTTNIEEWETDVLGLNGCSRSASGLGVEDGGFVDRAIEEWETDVLGLQLICAALEEATLASNLRDGFTWSERAAFRAECVAEYWEIDRDSVAVLLRR